MNIGKTTDISKKCLKLGIKLTNPEGYGKLPFKSFSAEEIRSWDIPNIRIVNATSLSGPTLEDKPLEMLEKQVAIGIDKIIDFRADAGKTLADKCRSLGLEYYKIPLDEVQTLRNTDYFVRAVNRKTAVTEKFIGMMKKYFALMAQGHAYVGCQYGIDRTNIGLTMNYLLNRNNIVPPRLLTWPDETRKCVLNRNIKAMKKIWKSMTPKQRAEMGISEGYEGTLWSKINRLLAANR